MSPGQHALASISLLFIVLQLCLWSLGLLILAPLRLVARPLRAPIDRALDGIYRGAVAVDDWWLERVIGIRWPRPALALDPDRSYVVIANHVSWSDPFPIQSAIVRKGPILKFLAKRELAAIPLLGLIFWAYDFPVLRRRSGPGGDEATRRERDRAALVAACRRLHERPAAILSFVEGTRFTPEKRALRGGRFRHLLDPRAGGFATLLDALGDEIAGVLDVTLLYSRRVSFWGFLGGALPEVGLEVEVVPIERIPADRAGRVAFLERCWRAKDERLEAWQARSPIP